MQVFVSYSRRDSNFVGRLVRDLQRADLNVWHDLTSINPGARWASSIVEAIETCDVFMLVLTPDSVASDNVAKEVAIADNRRKKIIPILAERTELSGTLEYSLTGLQWVDLTGQRYDRGLSELLEALDRGTRAATPIPPPRQRSGANRSWMVLAAVLATAVLAAVFVLLVLRDDGDGSTAETLPVTGTSIVDLTTSSNSPVSTTMPPTTTPVTPGSVPLPTRPLAPAEVLTASASSSRERQTNGCGGICYYLPENVLDGRSLTAWSEGADGLGEGESLSISFDRQHHLTSISMRAGWQRSDNDCLFRRNGRPKTLAVSFDTGEPVMWSLDDEPVLSVLPVDANTASVRIQIVDVYPGEVCGASGPYGLFGFHGGVRVSSSVQSGWPA